MYEKVNHGSARVKNEISLSLSNYCTTPLSFSFYELEYVEVNIAWFRKNGMQDLAIKRNRPGTLIARRKQIGYIYKRYKINVQ